MKHILIIILLCTFCISEAIADLIVKTQALAKTNSSTSLSGVLASSSDDANLYLPWTDTSSVTSLNFAMAFVVMDTSTSARVNGTLTLTNVSYSLKHRTTQTVGQNVNQSALNTTGDANQPNYEVVNLSNVFLGSPGQRVASTTQNANAFAVTDFHVPFNGSTSRRFDRAGDWWSMTVTVSGSFQAGSTSITFTESVIAYVTAMPTTESFGHNSQTNTTSIVFRGVGVTQYFDLECSTDLESWQVVSPAITLSGNDLYTYVINESSEENPFRRRFYRLRQKPPVST